MYSPWPSLHSFSTAFRAGTSGCLMRRISAAMASMSTFSTLALAAMSWAASRGMIPSAACSSASAASKSYHFCTRLWSLKMARSSSVLHKCLSSASSKIPDAIVSPSAVNAVSVRHPRTLRLGQRVAVLLQDGPGFWRLAAGGWRLTPSPAAVDSYRMPAVVTLKARDRTIGPFSVRRLLPAAQRQAVGPFLFFDHFGPLETARAADFDVRPHPHIGLATVTYLFEGVMHHRDSAGYAQRIEPGAINWMTAGRGIVHSERAPAELADKPQRTHGLQLWTGLPRAREEAEPSFSHTPASRIPPLSLGDARVRVLVGRAWGAESPVPTLMKTLYLDIALPAGGE